MCAFPRRPLSLEPGPGPEVRLTGPVSVSIARVCGRGGDWRASGPRGAVFPRPPGPTASPDPACRCPAAAMNPGAMRIHGKGYFQGRKPLLRPRPFNGSVPPASTMASLWGSPFGSLLLFGHVRAFLCGLKGRFPRFRVCFFSPRKGSASGRSPRALRAPNRGPHIPGATRGLAGLPALRSVGKWAPVRASWPPPPTFLPREAGSVCASHPPPLFACGRTKAHWRFQPSLLRGLAGRGPRVAAGGLRSGGERWRGSPRGASSEAGFWPGCVFPPFFPLNVCFY